MNIRIGNGIDFHQLEKIDKENDISLGGIKIKSYYKIIAHSDGDIILHALSDAILGACGEPDIGYFFPDTEQKNKNIDSKIILNKALEIMRQKNFNLINIDITILAEVPKINPYREKIKQSIAKLCNISIEQISIKATTTEKMGFIGRKEGLGCFVNVLLGKI
ncbi:MAG: 2-C-methyl-D-erythritol 2,4-cyclodiphosphate synthase [Leptospiraceae bacterium]|nr:MAG: 2-C-methyl-D-erythritol 2,4-cyclodiphosphate synthase [Leptospiraceae bacterium]